MIDAYVALGSGVWHEVREAARQRAVAAAVQAHQDELRECGYTKVRTRIVNRTEPRISKLRIVVESGNVEFEFALANAVPGRVFSDTELDIGSVTMPIPGTRVAVKWTGLDGWAGSEDAVVTGELPRAEGEGLAIVQFARNYRVYVHMYAEEPSRCSDGKERGGKNE